MDDNINQPKHYTQHPSGVECINIAEHFGFNLGNAFKYLFRQGKKGAPAEDLQKALWYIKRSLEYEMPDAPLEAHVLENIDAVLIHETGDVAFVMACIAWAGTLENDGDENIPFKRALGWAVGRLELMVEGVSHETR